MYRGFNLKISGDQAATIAKASVGERPMQELDELRKLISSQIIDADEVKNAWFTLASADVFLSHSGNDKELAYGLAEGIESKLGLKVFIDSRVWGGADRLLKEVDDKYCKNKDQASYNYDKRNYSTSHIHMMLATALSEMIDRCECVIFLNTPQSIQAEDAEHSAEEKVASPWIYHELTMTRLLRRRYPKRALAKRASTEARAIAEDVAPRFAYSAPLGHLANMSLADLAEWHRQSVKGKAALDWLYQKFEVPSAELAILTESLRL